MSSKKTEPTLGADFKFGMRQVVKYYKSPTPGARAQTATIVGRTQHDHCEPTYVLRPWKDETKLAPARESELVAG